MPRTAYRYSPSLREEVCLRYQQREEPQALALEVGIGLTTLYRWLRASGIPLNEKLSHDEKSDLCKRYLEGASPDSLVKVFGHTREVLRKTLVNEGITIRTLQGAARKYSINESFFSSIETEQQAYVLGFHAADGCVNTESTVSIRLARRDREHISRILMAMNSNYRIFDTVGREGMSRSRLKRETEVSYVQMHSRQMVADLTRLGFGPRKTHTIRWPKEQVPQHLQRHFLRGYFDGDGTCGVYLKTHYRIPVPQWALCGNLPFLEGVADFLKENGFQPSKITAYKRPDGTTSISKYAHGGRLKVGALARLMYDGATIFLPRKHEILQKFM